MTTKTSKKTTSKDVAQPKVVETLETRAAKSVARRVIGSFGYRAASSLDGGFDPSENLAICKAVEMDAAEISRSVDLFIDSLKPLNTDVKAIAEGMGCSLEEAQETLDDTTLLYTEVQESRDDLIEQLEAKYADIEPLYEISEFAHENLERVTGRAMSAARRSYMRTGDAEWVKAVRSAVKTTNDAFKIAA